MDNLQTQIDNLKTLQESYDAVAQAAEAYNVGKVQLAQAITSKGVETSPTETYPEMADKVNAISQDTIQLSGKDVYGRALFGGLNLPDYWDLYDIISQLLSDGRLVNYGGILLAEYYRGYDSLELSGAGAGGAYVVSDKDENDNFIMYTEDTVHVWHTNWDGKGDRWVAYCFADAGHNFTITNTGTSPRQIVIGRNVGTIESLVNGRVSSISVVSNGKLGSFNTNTYTQNFGKTVILFLDNVVSGENVLFDPITTELIYFKGKLSGSLMSLSQPLSNLHTIIVCGEFNDGRIAAELNDNYKVGIGQIIINGKGRLKLSRYNNGITADNVEIIVTVRETLQLASENNSFYPKKIEVYYTDTTQKLELQYANPSYNSWKNTEDVTLQSEWCYDIDISNCINLTEANMYAHILQCLKQDEPDCGDGVTITLGATNLAKLTSEESVQLLDDLTNIYGYTFA